MPSGFTIKPVEITRQIADKITLQAEEQLRQSRNYKNTRLQRVVDNEQLYLGRIDPQKKNPFNIHIPYMSGFVDHYLSKIDDSPNIEYTPQEEADFKAASHTTAAWEKYLNSTDVEHKIAFKDRQVKKNALFSGRGIYKVWTDAPEGKFQYHFHVMNHYDFHCEPAGGALLEDHLFCGEEFIFKTKEELQAGAKDGFYDVENVKSLTDRTTSNQSENKDVQDVDSLRLNRLNELNLDPQSYNFVGNDIYNLNEWYLTFEGRRYYVLFEERSKIWIRVKLLTDIDPSDRYPYVSWATHEDEMNFWSKAPCDDARPIHKYIGKALNQELYNREKLNKGQRAYDPEMFYDLEALSSWRPDGLVPVDRGTNGRKSIREGIHEFRVSGLNGTLDLVSFLDSYVGRQIGSTPSSQGVAEKDKKVGIFFGELQQVDEFLGLRNKSYNEAWAEIGSRFRMGLSTDLTTEGMKIKLMGARGVEWKTIKKEDIKTKGELNVEVTGGREQEGVHEAEKVAKKDTLSRLRTVSPRWSDEQELKIAGFSESEIKTAFTNMPLASQELMSEAAQSIEEILKGKIPALNRGANIQYMQKIIDTATELSDIPQEKFEQLIAYAMAHTEIAQRNEQRATLEIGADLKARAEEGASGEVTKAPAVRTQPQVESPVEVVV